jgi:hypothetical protein
MALTVNPERQRVWLIVIAIVFTNLVGWVAGGACLGGDAVSGYADDGKFYVGAHGKYTEVNQGVWVYSWVHTDLTFLASIPIAAAFGYWATRGSPREPPLS